MEQVNLDKVNLALSLINDAYWESIVDRALELEGQSRFLAGAYADICLSLVVTQLEVLEAKANGYKRISENAEDDMLPEIISQNMETLEWLEEKKRRFVAGLSSIQSDLAAIIDEIGTLGEAKTLAALLERRNKAREKQ